MNGGSTPKPELPLWGVAEGRTDAGRVEGTARLVLGVAALLPELVVRDNAPLPQGLTRRAVLALRAHRRRGLR